MPVPSHQNEGASENEEVSRFRSLGRVILSAIASGIDWIQIREKDAPGNLLFALAAGAASPLPALAASSGSSSRKATIVVNDRLDIALAARTGGIHLGETSIPLSQAVSWLHQSPKTSQLSDKFLIGASCHSLESALAAERDGAKYIFFGPVFATPSKAPFGPPQGLERLAEVCRAVRIPVLAIGGITLENASTCISAGAQGIAAIRLFQGAVNLRQTIVQLRKNLNVQEHG